MGFMDKAKEMLSGHKSQADEAVQKGGDIVDDKTGGKYEDKVDTAQEKATDYIDRTEEN